MKNAKAVKILGTISIILLIFFAVKTIFDYRQYQKTFTSAPFYVWVLINALFLVIPAIIVFIVSAVINKKNR